MIQNQKARGCEGFCVVKWDKKVVQSALVVLQRNNEANKSFQMSLQKTFEAQQSTILVCFCSNVLIHSRNVSIQNRKARGQSLNI